MREVHAEHNVELLARGKVAQLDVHLVPLMVRPVTEGVERNDLLVAVGRDDERRVAQGDFERLAQLAGEDGRDLGRPFL